jgi:hypothetical protein
MVKVTETLVCDDCGRTDAINPGDNLCIYCRDARRREDY